MLRGLARLVDGVEPDIIHSHFVATTLSMRLAPYRRRSTPRSSRCPGRCTWSTGPSGRPRSRLAGAPDYWVAACEWTWRTYLSEGVPADRVLLSYYGADNGQFLNRRRRGLRSELGLRRTPAWWGWSPTSTGRSATCCSAGTQGA